MHILGMHVHDKQHVKCMEGALEALILEPLLCWETEVKANRMAVHPANRNGLGIVSSKCLSLGAASCENGYSYQLACKDAVASSAPPTQQEWRIWNEGLNSRQSLPELSDPIGLSLGAGHGNGFLRLVLDNAPCTIKAIAPSGFLDSEFLCNRHPGLKLALEKGIRWRMIHYAVFERFPKLADVFQKALNSKNMQVITEVEGVLCMIETAEAVESPVWDDIAQEACQAKPFWQPWATQLARLVASTPKEILRECCDSIAAMVPRPTTTALTSTHVGGLYIEQVSKFKVAGLEPCLRLKGALWLANMLSPADQQEDGKCCLIKPRDVTFLTSKKNEEHVVLAEKMMDQMRYIATNKLQLDKETAKLLLARTDARIVYHLLGLGKKSADGMEFESLDAIASEFIKQAGHAKSRATQQAVTIPAGLFSDLRKAMQRVGSRCSVNEGSTNKKKGKKANAAPIEEEPIEKTSYVESLSEAKDVIGQLEKLGFGVGNTIKNKKRKHDGEPESLKILKLTEKSGARCVDTVDGTEKILTVNELVRDWKQCTNAIAGPLSGWREATPMFSKDYAIEILKNAINIQVFGLVMKNDENKVTKESIEIYRAAGVDREPGSARLVRLVGLHDSAWMAWL